MPKYVDALNDEPTVEIDGKRGVLRVCPVCGVNYAAERTWLRRGKDKFCSHACYAESTRTRSLEDSFWARVQKSDGCWLWTGTISRGYGVMVNRALGIHMPAHRYSYELHNGPLLPGEEACHTCDNPPCVRPDHLFAGTQTDNMIDATHKGRFRKGTEHHNAKLAPDDIPRILALRAQGLSYAKIAVHFGVESHTIGNVCRGVAWKHVTVSNSEGER